jgi:16S rRNA (cytosine1402-N4)-methyltransferase
MTETAHLPVMLGPVLEGLRIKSDGCYVDATFGRGGHSSAILNALGQKGRLIAIDRDPDAITAAPEALTGDERFELVRGEYAGLGDIVRKRGLEGRVDGILMDVGVSSPQLDDGSRGFSFMRDGPLDMRMDPEHGTSAADWLADVDEQELKRTLKTLGEERHAARIARAIVAARDTAPIERTAELADVVAAAVPQRGPSRRHPATQTFQAIRIMVNDELSQLMAGLDATIAALAAGGRLCVITFHSLEDRIVKRFMRDQSREPEQYRGMPDIPLEFRPKLALVGKAQSASEAEIDANPRARSARLRIAERTA